MHVGDNVCQRHELLTWLNIQTHVCIFEVLQLEGLFIGDLLCRLHWGWKRQNLADEVSSTVVHCLACLVINMSFYASDSVSTPRFPLSIISLLTYRSQWSLSLSLSLCHTHTHRNPQQEWEQVQASDMKICYPLLDLCSWINFKISL